MLATERAARLLGRLAAIAQAADEALADVEALAVGDGGARGEPARWLPGIKESLRRIQLECAELRFSTRELRVTLPPPESLQPRLL
jgi:hypothetical protein